VLGVTARYEGLKNAINRCAERDQPAKWVVLFCSSIMTDVAVGCLCVLDQVVRYKTINLVNEKICYLEEGIAMSSETLLTN